MPSLRNLGFNQRVPIVCSEDLDWANGKVQRCIRNRGLGFDGYIPTLNQFRGQKAQIANGVWRLLNMPLAINSLSPMPVTFVGQDALVGGWPERHGDVTLALQAGTAPDYQQPGAFRDGLGYCKFNGGGFYRPPATSFGDVTDEDTVKEFVVWSNPGGSAGAVAGKLRTAPNNQGWQLYNNGTALSLTIYTGGTARALSTASAIPNTLVHLLYILDKSGSGRAYMDGTVTATVDISAITDMSTATYFELGARRGAAFGYDGLYLYQEWNFGVGGLDSHVQDAIAKQRAAAIFGWLPLSSKGSDVPNTMSRNSAAYSDLWLSSARKYFFQGANAMRWSEPIEGTHGPLAEPVGDNDFASEDINTWTKVRCTISGSTIASPIGTARGIVGTAVDNTHVVTLAAIGGAQDVFSVLVKAGNKEWLYLDSAFGPNRDCYYHLTGAGAIGATPGANVTAAYIEPAGDGFYWCTIVYPGGGNHLHTIGPAHADNDNTFTGDGSTVDLWVDWAQHEDDGNNSRTSPMLGGTTRLADSFQMVAGDNIGGEDNQRGTGVTRVRLPNIDSKVTQQIFDITDGGASTKRVQLVRGNADADPFRAAARDSTGDIGVVAGTIDGSDGAAHDVRVLFRDGRIELVVDGVSDGVDTSVRPPSSGVDEFDMMQDLTGSLQFSGIVPVLRFLAQPSLKG